MTKQRIAVFGLGLMGSGMARNLLAKGFELAVFNRDPAKCQPLQAAGARVAGSPRDAASQAEVVISMVADDNASRTVWLGEAGALAGLRPGTVCIESSTLTVEWTRELAGSVALKNAEFLDAPVTGSKSHAANGELNFLVGGDAATLEKVRPVLAAMGRNIWPLGPVGSGAVVKLVNNFLCGVQVASLAEAFAMIERSGIDRQKALEVLTNGAPGSPLVKTLASRMAIPDYSTNFALRLMAKDLGYARQEAAKLSLDLATAAAALTRFRDAIEAGHGDQDMAAVAEAIRAESNEKR